MPSDHLELIQYAPSTDEVWKVTGLHRTAADQQVLHLGSAPGRSIVEYLVGQGHQVFVVSWRNPG